MDFRKGVLDDFAIIFNGTGREDSQDATSNDFADKWGWFGVRYRLTNGEIVNLERITELGLLECLTWLSYETDLNISKSVNLNSSNGSI